TIENRLISETKLMGYIAESLHFLYVSDDTYFMQQLNANIRTEQKQLESEGITSEFLYIKDTEATPFPVSEKSTPSLPTPVIEKISEQRNGQLNSTINGEIYTISFQEMVEIDGIYVVLVPRSSFMAPITNMGLLTIIVISVSIIISILLI